MEKLIVISLIATAAFLTGCDAPKQEVDSTDPWVDVGRTMEIRTVMVKGHEYVLMDGYKCGGIVHAASCPCMSK